MGDQITDIYLGVLKFGGRAKVERIKDGVYGISIYRDIPDQWGRGTKLYQDRRFFYLYPRNRYTKEFP